MQRIHDGRTLTRRATLLATLAVVLLIQVANAQESEQTTTLPATCALHPDGSMPAEGQCAGPLQRAALRRQARDANDPCTVAEVGYTVDGAADNYQCGECAPGDSGYENPSTCGLNEYCSDEGVCTSLMEHPLHLQACPYEIGVATKYGWCGAGLRCYQHVCRVCEDGVQDLDGKVCVSGEWTYNRWLLVMYTPDTLINVVLILLLLVWLILCVVTWRRTRRAEKRQQHAVQQEEAAFA
jgi:hypothetical protein